MLLLNGRTLYRMRNKKQFDKTLGEIADLVLDMLADLPPEKARAAKDEMRQLASRSSRASNRGISAKRRKTAGLRLSRPAASRSA